MNCSLKIHLWVISCLIRTHDPRAFNDRLFGIFSFLETRFESETKELKVINSKRFLFYYAVRAGLYCNKSKQEFYYPASRDPTAFVRECALALPPPPPPPPPCTLRLL